MNGLIRASGKYFKTDMVYLARGGFWLTLGQVITAVSSFLLSIAFANLVPKTIYGTFRYITSVSSTLNAFSLTGVGTALVRSVAKGYEGALRHGFLLSIRWSALLVFLSFAGAAYYYLRDNITLAVSLLFIGSFSPFLNASHLATYFANGKKDFKRLSIYNVVKGVLPAILIAGTLFVTENILIIVFVYFISNSAIAFLTYWNALKFYKPNTEKDPELLPYSKKLSALGILSTIAAHADKILIFTLLGSVELATYAVAVSFPEQIKTMLRNLNFLMIPKFAEKKISYRLDIGRKIWQLALLLVVIMVAYMVAAPLLFRIFFPAYNDSVSFSIVFAISIATSLAMVPNSILIARKHERELLEINVAGSIIQLLLLFSFIKLWGLWGVIVSKVIAAYVNLALPFFAIRRHYKL